jgi:hypothetical protein
VFEGKNPIIKGEFDLHFFPTQPTAILGTTLAKALSQKAGMLNVNFKGKPALPRFSLISDLADKGKHTIVFDTSGRDGKQIRSRHSSSATLLKTISWSRLELAVLQDPSCTTGCDKSGSDKGAASPGLPGTNQPQAFSPPKSADGNCTNTAEGSMNGVDGSFATDEGLQGGTGGLGNPGANGDNAGNIDARVNDGDFNTYSFIANGGRGGSGGEGGAGGAGGNGGKGGDGGNGIACSCDIGRGGNGGSGNDGGKGGTGGTGGKGGDGGSLERL